MRALSMGKMSERIHTFSKKRRWHPWVAPEGKVRVISDDLNVFLMIRVISGWSIFKKDFYGWLIFCFVLIHSFQIITLLKMTTADTWLHFRTS